MKTSEFGIALSDRVGLVGQSSKVTELAERSLRIVPLTERRCSATALLERDDVEPRTPAEVRWAVQSPTQ